MMAYGLGAMIGVILPYSRLHETEADRIGLVIMAMTGYDPHAAIGFWENMSRGGKQHLEFLRTHPTDRKRYSGIYS